MRSAANSKPLGTVLVLLAWVTSAVLVPGAASAESQAVISIHAVYDAVPTPDVPCGGLRVAGKGTATGPPVGRAAWQDNECASLLAQPGKITITGNLALTTSSGDRLEASYTAMADLPGLDGAIYPSGTFTVTGGTGRFDGATGTGWITATGNIFSPAAVAEMYGAIVYRA